MKITARERKKVNNENGIKKNGDDDDKRKELKQRINCYLIKKNYYH